MEVRSAALRRLRLPNQAPDRIYRGISFAPVFETDARSDACAVAGALRARAGDRARQLGLQQHLQVRAY